MILNAHVFFVSVQVIDVDQFEVVIVSPRNHFVFTPMLPSTAVGTVEFRCAAAQHHCTAVMSS